MRDIRLFPTLTPPYSFADAVNYILHTFGHDLNSLSPFERNTLISEAEQMIVLREKDYDDGWDDGYREASEEAEQEIEDAENEGREDGVGDCIHCVKRLKEEILSPKMIGDFFENTSVETFVGENKENVIKVLKFVFQELLERLDEIS